MSSRFGAMLQNRRRELGMSIQQVSNEIKLRPQTIEYFELGRLDAMPPRGYATGMISSYARYLGLNPREVIDAYYDELELYERVNNTGAGRFLDSVAEASPHSDNAAGRFYMVNSVPNSRYAQRPPQAGYVSESTSLHEPAPVSSLRAERPPHRLRYGQQRSLPASSAERRSANSLQPRDRFSDRDRSANAGRRPYPAGYPASGFARSQGPSRPMPLPGDQRSSRTAYGASSRRRPVPAPSGPDPRLMAAVALVVLILLALLAFFAFRSCGSQPSNSDMQAQQAPATSSVSAESDSDDDLFDDEPVDAQSSATDLDPQDSPVSHSGGSQKGETTVTISIAKGKTSWVEVKLDGKYVYSDTPVGPFEQEYTVGSSIEITVDNPADVVIRKNGEKIRYDSKSSGVGRVTINAPAQPNPASVDEPADDSDTDARGTGNSTVQGNTQSDAPTDGVAR